MSSAVELLSQFAVLLNECGPDSAEVNEFLDEHRGNADFIELAEISITLKKALTCPYLDNIVQESQWN
jgi:hypothetical protein